MHSFKNLKFSIPQISHAYSIIGKTVWLKTFKADQPVEVSCLYACTINVMHSVIVLPIRIFNGCEVLIENSVTRVTVRHHEACRVMPNSYPSNGVFNLLSFCLYV